jgi:hypothetical protein
MTRKAVPSTASVATKSFFILIPQLISMQINLFQGSCVNPNKKDLETFRFYLALRFFALYIQQSVNRTAIFEREFFRCVSLFRL